METVIKEKQMYNGLITAWASALLNRVSTTLLLIYFLVPLNGIIN